MKSVEQPLYVRTTAQISSAKLEYNTHITLPWKVKKYEPHDNFSKWIDKYCGLISSYFVLSIFVGILYQL